MRTFIQYIRIHHKRLQSEHGFDDALQEQNHGQTPSARRTRLEMKPIKYEQMISRELRLCHQDLSCDRSSNFPSCSTCELRCCASNGCEWNPLSDMSWFSPMNAFHVGNPLNIMVLRQTGRNSTRMNQVIRVLNLTQDWGLQNQQELRKPTVSVWM